jgi:hypothetical protein
VQGKGDLSDSLSVKVRKPPDRSVEFVQTQLIDSILEVLKLVEHGGGNQAKTYNPPCKHNNKMNQDEGGKEFDCSWDYKSVIGKLNYLEKSARGNIAISVHSCAQYMCQTLRTLDLWLTSMIFPHAHYCNCFNHTASQDLDWCC